MSQALQFAQDLKLGHYMKIPPRPMFMCQVVATVVAGTVQLAVQEWMFANIKDICDDNQRSDLSCPHNQVFFTASAVWCVVMGPFLFYLNAVVDRPFRVGVSLDQIDSSAMARFTISNFTQLLSERSCLFPSGYGNDDDLIRG